MARVSVGERVGAIAHTDEKTNTAYIFGYGRYDGVVMPPPDSGVLFFGAPLNRPNPKITLDSGKVVWGCECWWGTELEVRRMIRGKTVVELDIDAERAKADAAPASEDT